jgi:dolichol-phosphate mannosyltransferase
LEIKKIDLSVVVAAYNEGGIISKSLQCITDELDLHGEISWELICVNDGSTDDTGAIMDKFAENHSAIRIYHHRRNRGQGRALQTGFIHCNGQIIVTLDADLSYGAEYIFKLRDALLKENVEVVLASPYAEGGMVKNVPFYRHLLSRMGNFYLARMSQYPISTSTCVVRAYRREVIDSLLLTSDGMELQLEILMKAAVMGYRVCEVPAKLEWAEEKLLEADFRRVSKMRLFRTIRLYLLMGWLTRPAAIFMVLSCLMLLCGLFMFVALFYRILEHMGTHPGVSWVQSASLSLQEVFQTYAYSFIIYGGVFLIGLQIFTYALLLIQNKYHFEELFRLGQEILKARRREIYHNDRETK